MMQDAKGRKIYRYSRPRVTGPKPPVSRFSSIFQKVEYRTPLLGKIPILHELSITPKMTPVLATNAVGNLLEVGVSSDGVIRMGFFPLPVDQESDWLIKLWGWLNHKGQTLPYDTIQEVGTAGLDVNVPNGLTIWFPDKTRTGVYCRVEHWVAVAVWNWKSLWVQNDV